MKKITLLICLFLISIAYSQDKASGYYVNMAGQRIDGYFKVGDFLNADNLKFATSADGNAEALDPKNIQEYGIGNDYKFVKQTVQIDKSSIMTGRLSGNKEPNWATETIFLNVLLEGDATLYSYMDSGTPKYFYKVNSGNVNTKQLVYKKYMATANASAENNQYRQQLYADLKCSENEEINKFLKINYSKNDMLPLFKAYNTCKNSSSKEFVNSTGVKTAIHLSVFAGYSQTKFGIEGVNKTNTESGSTFSAGFEGLLLFSSQKLGVFARVEYERLSAQVSHIEQATWSAITSTYTYTADANLINVYAGPRYFISLADKHKLYVDAAFVATLPSGSIDRKVVTESSSGATEVDLASLNMTTAFSFNVGAGYMFNNKFAAEIRMNTNRNLLGDNGVFEMAASRIGLNLVYTIK